MIILIVILLLIGLPMLVVPLTEQVLALARTLRRNR